MVGWRIYFWEPTVSPHKLELFRALRNFPEVASCTYIAQAELADDRRAQGWSVGKLSDLDLKMTPTLKDIDAIVRGGGDKAVHLFSGIHGPPVVTAGISAALRHRARFGILSEPRASEGLNGLIRLAHSWATERRMRRHAAFVLAIGRNGPSWFRRAGYPATRVFPFAYFLPPVPAHPHPPLDNYIRLGYLGRLTEDKGIRLLLSALPLLPPHVKVSIAGYGDDIALVEAAAAADTRVRYLGALPMAEVPEFLCGVDILTQPSLTTSDGWGAVVSEALLAGTAVIATTKVGASILLESPDRGRVLLRPDPSLLAAAVESLAGSALAPHAREMRRNWAATRLTGVAGATNLLSIFGHCFAGAPAPAPYWH